MTTTKSNPDVERIVTEAVKTRLTPFGLDRVVVEFGPDHDGDSGVLIDIYYHPAARKADARSLTDLLFQIHEELSEAGEDRFPYIRHHFDEMTAKAS